MCLSPEPALLVLQVVHHPTIVAMHGEGESWTYTADADVRAKFWGRSVELIPVGLIRLKFDDGDEYEWTKVSLATYLCTGSVELSCHGIHIQTDVLGHSASVPELMYNA